jgi:DNA-binding FadR family transcriptional regulator
MQIEPHAARQASHRRTNQDLDRLGELVSELACCLDDPAAFTAVDHRIHRHLATVAGNPIITDLFDRLTAVFQISRQLTSPQIELRRATLRQMCIIVDAVRSHDGLVASKAMTHHLHSVWAVARGAQGPEGESVSLAPAALSRRLRRQADRKPT